MNLQPLYDVKQRLEQAAIAGAGLLREDFRLQRAAEQLKPLAAASPVLGKLDAGLEKLLSAPAEERSGLLLDLLALTDAVAYTQGTTGAEGELIPLVAGSGDYCDVSYSQIQPLVTALTTTGGGRMEIVQESWKTHPECFTDFRVLPLLIADLADKFSGLADLNMRILAALGPAVIPVLKQGFNPAGKAAMARRVEALEKSAGAGENAFYLEMLPKSKGEVQLALIRALRHDPANGPRLVELCRTKKGEAQETAYWALVRSEAPEARQHYAALAQEDPDQALKYLRGVDGQDGWASHLTARLFQAELDRVEEGAPLTKKTQERFALLLAALCGKRGEVFCQVCRRGAALGRLLEQPMEGSGGPMRFELSYGLSQAAKNWKNFRPQLALVLEGMLMRYPDPELRSLALELYREHGECWLPAALLAQLYALDSAACYAWGESQFYCCDGGARTVDPQAVDAYCRVFGNVQWSGERGRYEISPLWNYGPDAPFITPIAELDPRWFGLFAAAGVHMRHLLVNLLRGQRDRPDILAQMGDYLYNTAVTGDNPNYTHMYIQVLAGLGWRDWKDFFVKRGEYVGELIYLELKMGLEELPVSLEERIEALEAVSQLGRQGKIHFKFYNGWPEKEIQKWIDQWKLAQAKGETGNG